MRFLSVSRAECFSPRSVARDAAVLSRVEQLLRADGHEVERVSEDDAPAALPAAAGIVSMARGEHMLSLLSQAEARGVAVMNAPQGVLRCSRVHLAACCSALAIPSPQSWVLTEGAPTSALCYPLWLKRGDACAQQEGDVVFVSASEQLPAALTAFWARGIRRVVAVRHLEGQLIKFYGVEHMPFFFTCRPEFSKFGLEAHNDGGASVPFSAEHLRAAACRLAAHVGVPVFGGDAVVGGDGVARIIDFNDWPSFAPCLDAAAPFIVQRFYQQLRSCKTLKASR